MAKPTKDDEAASAQRVQKLIVALLNDAIIQSKNSGKNILLALPEEKLATLLIQLMPKSKDIDADLAKNKLDLEEMLKDLPEEGTILKELKEAKIEIVSLKYKLGRIKFINSFTSGEKQFIYDELVKCIKEIKRDTVMLVGLVR